MDTPAITSDGSAAASAAPAPGLVECERAAKQLSVAELKDELAVLGAEAGGKGRGKKAALVQALQQHLDSTGRATVRCHRAPSRLTVAELRQALAARGMESAGNKAALVARLQQVLG